LSILKSDYSTKTHEGGTKSTKVRPEKVNNGVKVKPISLCNFVKTFVSLCVIAYTEANNQRNQDTNNKVFKDLKASLVNHRYAKA
jgi:hypothetical protein